MSENVHDQNFKLLMANPTFLEGFLKTYLPKDLQEKLDWSSLKPYKPGGELVEEKTKKTFESDIVLQAKLSKDACFLWIHCEHQSTSDLLMPLRILNYQTAEVLTYGKQNPGKKLPGIISFIYYQGERPWVHSLEIKSLFKDQALFEHYFGKPILLDIAAMKKEDIKKHTGIGSIECFLKAIRLKTLDDELEDLLPGLVDLDSDLKLKTLEYAWEFTEYSEQEFSDIWRKNLLKKEEDEMGVTLKQRFIEEGIQQGFSLGKHEGFSLGKHEGFSLGKDEGFSLGIAKEREEIAKRMLLAGSQAQFIQEVTGFSETELKKIRKTIEN